MGVGYAVFDAEVVHGQAVEHAADVGVVVDADHHLAFAGSHGFCHLLVLLEAERNAVSFHLPVGRIAVEEGVRAVVALDAVLPAQVLDRGALCQAQVGGGQVLFDAQQIDGRGGGSGAEVLAVDLATEGMLLQVEEAGGALDVGERLCARALQPLEDLPAAQRPLELPHELLEVMLHDPVHIHQLPIDVVQHLDVRRVRPQEVDRGTTAEHLDVAFVLRKQGDQAVSQPALAAHPRDDRRGFLIVKERSVLAHGALPFG